MKLRTAVLLLAFPIVAVAQDDPVKLFFDRMDTNKDGKVVLEEFQRPVAENFKRIDANGDGGINPAEAKAFGEKMRRRMRQMPQQRGGSYPGR